MVWTLEEAFPMFSFPSAPRKQEVASLTPLKIVKKKKKKNSETDGTGRDDYQIKPRMSIKAAAGFHFHLKIGVLLPDGWLAGWLAGWLLFLPATLSLAQKISYQPLMELEKISKLKSRRGGPPRKCPTGHSCE